MFEKFKAKTKEIINKLKRVDVDEAKDLERQGKEAVAKTKVVTTQLKETKKVDAKDARDAAKEGKKFLGIFGKATKEEDIKE